MPNHFIEEVDGFPEPTLLSMLAELKEGLREFSLQVRSLGDVANANMGAQARYDMNI